MTVQVLHMASASFESARQLICATGSPALQGLHGHSFRASALGHAIGGDYPGGQLDAVQQAWSSLVAKLDYQALHTLMDQPTDVAIARWLGARCAGLHTPTVCVQSTLDQGCWVGGLGGGTVWRRYHFQAAHHLPNVPAGHKCGNVHGHSFAVVLYATQDGVDSSDALGYAALDCAWNSVLGDLDHAYLNDIEGLENPTSEMLASWLWRRLKPCYLGLEGVSVYETASCGAHFDGMRYQIWKDFTLDSAAVFPDAPPTSARRRLHGYTYTLRLHLSAELDRVFGWARDFGDVKAVFAPTFARLDHQPLHQLSGLQNCGVESLARWIWDAAFPQLPQLCALELYETRGCGALLARPGCRLMLPL